MKGVMIGDLLVLVLIVFALCFTAMISYKVLGGFRDQFENDTQEYNVTTQGMASVQLFDWGSIFLIVAMSLVIFVSAYMIPSHPIFVVPGIITLVIMMVVVPIFSNTFESIVGSGSMTETASQFTMMQYIWLNMPTIIGLIGIILMIVMFSKARQVGVV